MNTLVIAKLVDKINAIQADLFNGPTVDDINILSVTNNSSFSGACDVRAALTANLVHAVGTGSCAARYVSHCAQSPFSRLALRAK